MLHQLFSRVFPKVAAATVFAATIGFAAQAQTLDLGQNLPIDSSVTKGQLANGLTYYIKPNAKPAQKVELRLVVDAGSILENDNQQGLAHFMEHMEFNGLKHFPKNELVNYLQNIGVQFGADLNANTGWDRTYFLLPIPTDKPGNLDNGFQILSDWAGGALITTDEVNDERHVILEELRMRDKNASTRMMRQFLPEMLNDSRYAYRLPGGKDSIVGDCDPDRIREFYHDWYRPNLMAVIVIGDITVPKAKAMIQKYFGGLKNPANEKSRTYYEVKPYTAQKALIITDPEATNYGFTLMFPAHKVHVEKTLQDYRDDLVRSIFVQSLNRKLRDLAQTANPPYTNAGVDVGGNIGGITLKDEGFELDITPLDSIGVSINAAIGALLRVQQYGFTAADIQTTKNQYLAYFEKAYNERNTTLSARYADEFARNFMRQEPIPGIVNEYNYVKEMLPSITPEEVNKEADKWLSDHQNFFTMITGPAKGKITLPTEAGLLKMVNDAFQQKVTAAEAKETATSLLTTQPTPGKIVSASKDAQLGTTTYTLSNGIKVTVKPTTFKSDEIVFTGVKKGGTGQFGAADKANAHFLSNVIGVMGYGQFTPSALQDFLSGKTVSLNAEMGQASDAVTGSSSVKDFSTLLELNYLELTEPRKDNDLFQGFVTKLKAQLKFIKANPQAAFVDTLVKVMYHNSPLAPIAVPSEADIDNLDMNRCLEIYKDQFSNADGFHFFIVGNISEANLKPLIEKYIASLPVKGTKPMYKDNGLRMVSGTKAFKFYKGNDQKSLILSQYHGDIKYSDDLALKADLLGQAMTIEMLDTIREKMAAIYSGGVNATLKKVPYPHYVIMAQMPCGPENVDKIMAEYRREVAQYKKDGVPEVNLEKVKKAAIEKYKENMKDNSYWAQNLQEIMVWGNSKDYFLHYDQKVNSVTEKDMKAAANELLGDNVFTAISFPEVSTK